MSAGQISFTFDDGKLSTYTNVFPLMREAGIRGHIAVVTDTVGEEGQYTWDQIAEMAAGGWEIMCHSRTHDFHGMDEKKTRGEVVESREILKKRGYPTRVFNFPGGPWSGEKQFDPGTPFEALVRATYEAYLPDHGPGVMRDPVDRYMIGHVCCECYEMKELDLPLPKIVEAVDQAARDGAWCQLLWHDVKGRHVGKFKNVLVHVVPLVESGRLRNVTVSEHFGLGGE